jgi:hypothetical protein
VILLVLFLVACGAPPRAADPLRTARQHIEASRCAGVDRYAQAVADLEAALSADPNQLEAYYWLFVAQRARGDSSAAERARAALEEAVAAGRGGPAGRFWLLRLYREAGDQEVVQRGTELEFVIMVIAVSCVKLLSAHNSTQHTSRKHKV